MRMFKLLHYFHAGVNQRLPNGSIGVRLCGSEALTCQVITA